MIAFSLGLRRAFLVLGVALVALVGLSPAAQAAPYEPAGKPEISTSSPAPGGSVTVSGGGFKAGLSVTAVIYSDPVTLGTAIADAAGEVSLSVTIPKSFAPGSTHTLQLEGIDPNGDVRVLAQSVTIADSTGALAYTGATVLPFLAVGGALLVGGLLLIARARRGSSARA